jgi:hypothetical protein
LVGTKNNGTKHSDEIMSWAKELGIEIHADENSLVWTFRGLCLKKQVRIPFT